MTDDPTNTSGDAAAEEPALTQKNSETVRGETTLADEGAGSRPKVRAVPSSYGAAGGTTDAYEEGAGEADSHAGA